MMLLLDEILCCCLLHNVLLDRLLAMMQWKGMASVDDDPHDDRRPQPENAEE
jgi:hypothetical protein